MHNVWKVLVCNEISSAFFDFPISLLFSNFPISTIQRSFSFEWYFNFLKVNLKIYFFFFQSLTDIRGIFETRCEHVSWYSLLN